MVASNLLIMAKEKNYGINVKKEDDFSEWYTQLIERAELADVRYGIKGFVPYREWAQMSIEKMFRVMSDELDRTGHMPICLPCLIPEKNFHIESEHVEGFTPEVFWVTEHGNGEKFEEKYALRPTSETAFYQMYALWIQSHKDLPYKRYQRANVFRCEGQQTRPFFRAREFHWIEAHNAFANEEDAIKQVHEDMEMTENILYNEFGIPHIFFERPQWDKFPGAEKTFAADALMGSGKVLQLPSTHLLGTKFSKPFNVTFKDKDGEEKLCHITCYGPAISRIYGAMISLHGDDKGLKLPFDLAPLQIVIVPILFKDSKDKVLAKCQEISETLKEYSVKIDDDEDLSPGKKFNTWELKGVPIRIEVGPKDLDNKTVMIARRDLDSKESVSESDVVKYVDGIAKEFTNNLIKTAEKDFENSIVDAKTFDEVKKSLDDQKIVRACFCSNGSDGEQCAEKIEKELSTSIRGTKVGVDEKPDGKCVSCGGEAKAVVYIAKSY